MPLSSIGEIESCLLDRMALAMVRKTAEHYNDPMPAKPDLTLTRMLVEAALNEIDVRVWDLHKLASGDYSLCDGYCNNDW
jgi:hypothetical protein